MSCCPLSAYIVDLIAVTVLVGNVAVAIDVYVLGGKFAAQ